MKVGKAAENDAGAFYSVVESKQIWDFNYKVFEVHYFQKVVFLSADQRLMSKSILCFFYGNE